MKQNSIRPTAKAERVNFAFFGTSEIAVMVLDELEKAGFVPALVVTTPDKKSGRGLQLTPSPVKLWAEERHMQLLQPEELHSHILKNVGVFDVFIVADYGKLIPKEILEMPKRGTLNVHPSLLPRLRGPSPIKSTILFDEKKVGTSVMVLDEEMDHGPIVAQKQFDIVNWPPRASELEEILVRGGGRLLAQILPEWVAGNIEAREQNHDLATFSEKIEKEDGLLDLNGDAYQNLLKIRAFEGWPGTYAFFERGGKKIRVQIVDANIINSKLVITKVKPEGKKEMAYEELLRSGAKPTA